ncbi:hypothetical protein PoMZ_08671 [Pyricularia oryzae]|uniref:Uncharacterized protein n=1 Tax=Pyricularia oryzae TaxID=318829 RepID=A0A4P7NI88_PYROR|nr:hypothetical protein PoMZ_08671 [Pyricularia oryzae]
MFFFCCSQFFNTRDKSTCMAGCWNLYLCHPHYRRRLR